MLSNNHVPTLFAASKALLQLRARVAWQTIIQKPAAQTVTALALILVLPAAYQIGKRAATAHSIGGPTAPALLTGALILLLVLQILLLLAGNSGTGGVAEPVPAKVTQVLPIPFGALLAADAVCFLLSLPSLFLLAAFVPLVTKMGIAAALPLFLLGVLGILMALAIARLGTILGKRLGPTGAAIGVLILGAALLATLPRSAVASVIHEKKKEAQLLGKVPPAPVRMSPLVRYTPPGMAATALNKDGTVPSRVLAMLALAASVAVVVGGTIALERWGERLEPWSAGGRPRRNGIPRPAGSLQTELRLLLRNPAAHLPLRAPAALFLMMGYAWIAPNLGPDAVQNLADLLGIGATVYTLIWQTQLVCNRFGNDAGTAAMLFALPMPRWRLLLEKNAALGIVLFIVDGGVAALFAAIAGNHRLIPTLLLALPAVLLLFTALGNITSLLSSFAITKQAERRQREPDRSLLFVYALVIGGTAFLFTPVQSAIGQWGSVGFVAGWVYAGALYAASLGMVALLLNPARERRIIAVLDGVK